MALVVLIGLSCNPGEEPREEPAEALNVVMAGYDVAVGRGQRFIVGAGTSDNRFVSFGQAKLRFAFQGTKDKPVSGPFGKTVTASFLLVDGAPTGPPPREARAGSASQGRGVYETRVDFDQPGFWKVRFEVDLESGRASGDTTFEVLSEHRVPAPGDRAPATENLTLHSTDAPRQAVDSRGADGPIPDEVLHAHTVAEALAAGRPAVVVLSTPVFCVSRFCGPVTDIVQELAGSYADRAWFIHIEVWRDFQAKTINKAAAEWIYRADDLNEPWVFLIGADGVITERWDNVLSKSELEESLKALPRLPSP